MAMTAFGVYQILLFFALILACAKPLGMFMARLFEGQRTFLHPVLRPLEAAIYRLSGVREDLEQRWTAYAGALLAFSAVKFVFTYLIQRLQGFLPLNPQGFGTASAASGATPMTPDLAFNTAVSFVTNTNWQSYVGETTMSYFAQMTALTVQNFTSAAAGIAIAIALVRGFARHGSKTIGNFWVDVTRATVYLLLPLSLVVALLFVSQGVIQNWDAYTQVKTVEGAAQTIAQGPVASQEAIKMLGTNGGGFFNANSSHPFENPTPASTLLQVVLIFLIPGALACTFGEMVRDRRQGWALFAAMSLMFFIGAFVAYGAEQHGNPAFDRLGVQSAATAGQPGGNMEGKEVRFGIAQTALFATVTTDASCGAINGWHDSFTPLGGLVPLANMQLSEVVFGGVGAGMYGVLVYIILSVFIAGLMVGRTPEYLGKKIQAFEVQMAMLTVLVFSLVILTFTAISSVSPGFGTSSVFNPGPHGLSEMLYAYSSGAANNGSAFGGLGANTKWYNTTLGFAMLFGRFFMIIPPLAIAGSLSRKKQIPASLGTFPVTTPLFSALLVGVIVIVGALTFFPALSLGPIVEHFMMSAGQVF
jgi:K+-transporting ATPase ATPase A chain